MHYYQFNIGDYRRDTGHLSLLEHGIYRSLIDSCYLNEIPLCEDDAILMRTHCIRTSEEEKAFKNVLRDFFILTKKGYTHKKCLEQIKKYNAKSEKARLSAKVRWDAKAMRTHSEGNANHKPLTNNHKPIVKRTNQLDIDLCFDNFWKSGIRKVNKKKAKSLFTNILKKTTDQGWSEFTEILTEDIYARLNSNQLGFKEMHPTTYLNGERWKDAIIKNHEHGERGYTLDQLGEDFING